jgi:hypothetical protein
MRKWGSGWQTTVSGRQESEERIKIKFSDSEMDRNQNLGLGCPRDKAKLEMP